jgi:hypothetical protein
VEEQAIGTDFFGKISREGHAQSNFRSVQDPETGPKSPLAPAPSCGGDFSPSELRRSPLKKQEYTFIAGFIVAVIEAKSPVSSK